MRIILFALHFVLSSSVVASATATDIRCHEHEEEIQVFVSAATHANIDHESHDGRGGSEQACVDRHCCTTGMTHLPTLASVYPMTTSAVIDCEYRFYVPEDIISPLKRPPIS